MSWGPLRPRSVAPREHGDGSMMNSYFRCKERCAWRECYTFGLSWPWPVDGCFGLVENQTSFHFWAPKKHQTNQIWVHTNIQLGSPLDVVFLLGVVLLIIGGSMLSIDLHLPSRRWTPPRSSSSQGSRFDCFSDWFGRKQKELTKSQNAKS